MSPKLNRPSESNLKVIPASPFVKQQEPVVYSETPQVAKAQEVPKVVTPKRLTRSQLTFSLVSTF